MAKPKQKLYDWGDGRKVHTIPKSEYEQNREARRYGINLDAPVSAPLSNRQTYGMAQQGADLEYGPKIQAAELMQRSVPEWYAGYQASVAAQQGALQAQANPLLQQAQQGVTNAGTMTAPGLDPNSPQYAVEQQAAKGRQSIAQLGYDSLAAIPTAAQGYLGGQASIAARELPQVQAMYGQQVGQLRGERGAAVTKAYGDLRAGEQNAQIAYTTLAGNQANNAAEIDIARGYDPVTGKALPKEAPTGYGAGGPGQNKYGYTYDEWSSLSPKEQAKERKGEDKSAQKEAEKAAAEAKTRKEAVKVATGKTRNTITNIIDYRQEDVGGLTDDTSKPKDPKTGEYPPRKATQADIDKEKVRKYGMLGRIAIAVREGKPLTEEQQAYLHQRDKDFRIPREWIKGKNTTPQRSRPDNTRGSIRDIYG